MTKTDGATDGAFQLSALLFYVSGVPEHLSAEDNALSRMSSCSQRVGHSQTTIAATMLCALIPRI